MKQLINLVLLSLIIFAYIPAKSQDKETLLSWERIKSNSEYIHGEGYGTTIKEADENALHDLLSKISLQVSGSFDQRESEITTNNNVDSRTEITSIIKTYTSGTLTNTQKMIIMDEPDARVGRYIKTIEVHKIFDNRKARVENMLNQACKAESKGRIDIALRNFYWAYVLTRSLQHPSEMSYSIPFDNSTVKVIDWVPEHINVIFDDIQINVAGRTGDDVDLNFSYLGKPVTSLDFKYFDGREWTPVASVNDGMSRMELASGYQATSYKLALEFVYTDGALSDPDIKSTIGLIKPPSNLFRHSYVNVLCENRNESQPVKPQSVHKTSLNGDTYVNEKSFSTVPGYGKPQQFSDSLIYKRIMTKVIDCIKNKTYADHKIDGYFTEHGLFAYKNLVEYGSASILASSPLRYYRFAGETIVRGLFMQFKFKNGIRKSFVEDVIFTFDKQGKIDNVTFGLDRTAEDDIFGKKIWDEGTRYAIMQFLENYKTAYAMKDLKYLDAVFDKDAVIISGHVTKKVNSSLETDGNVQLNKDVVYYKTYNKKQFMDKLRMSFNSKEFINIRFSDNEVYKLGKGGESFGIEIAQDYYSSNYADKGYLMLIVDLNDPKLPVIRFRSWQPEKDPNFGMGDIK